MRNYIKKRKEEKVSTPFEATKFYGVMQTIFTLKKPLIIAVAVLVSLPIVAGYVAHRGLNTIEAGDEGVVAFASSPLAAASANRGVITVPAGIVKANPFVPYRDLDGVGKAGDVPAYNLVEPPEVIDEHSDAARVMDTIVSGILYDKYSPSAILNIEGNDYLVKKGDVVNNYKIVNIVKDAVTVKLGSNVYTAGIGEILTEGSLTHNDVSNLSNKFGGER